MKSRDELLEELLDTNRSSALPGWCTVEKGKRIAKLVEDAHARLSVELGVFGGRSLVALALGGDTHGGHVHGIDPYEKGPSLEGTNDTENDRWWSTVDYEDVLRRCRAGLVVAGVEARVRLVRARSLDVVDQYPPGTIDVLHQDSNHSQEVSCAEVRAWGPKLRPGGYWVIDDTNWPSTKMAQALLEQTGFVLLEDHDWWRIYQRAAS